MITKRSWIGDLWHRAFRSGNPLYLMIAINVVIFLVLGILSLTGALRITSVPLAEYAVSWLQLPADVTLWLYRPWTVVTYMFTQQGLFHILFNMLWLFWLGIIFLDFLKKAQFTFVYLAGGLAGATVYLLAYNLIPVFREDALFTAMIGASASVSAVGFATATLVPDYTVRGVLFGNVRME